MLNWSAMKRSPLESTATPVGSSNSAAVAVPSPLNPAVPLPATVVMMPVARSPRGRGCAGVGDKDVAGGVHRHARRGVQLGGGGRAVIAAVTLNPVAGDGGDHAGAMIDLADAIVAVSAMKMSPAESTATAAGAFSSAAVAWPPSPGLAPPA